MLIQTVLIAVLAAFAAAAAIWALAGPYLTGEARAEKRQKAVSGTVPGRVARNADPAQQRRAQIAETLKDLEARQRHLDRPNLAVRLEQAGLDWSNRRFYVISAAAAAVAGLAALIVFTSPLAAVGGVALGGLVLPRWWLSRRRKKRQERFLNEFPNAVDVIVRGVKSGLPLIDCLRIVAQESQEPVKSEFKAMLETQAIGVPIGEAVLKLYERIGVAEANFFGIVISVQQKSGGSLSDALGNLSRVLRDRKKMKAKIQAMSMEAKASAGIIGSLPPVVMTLVYLTSPKYIELLWITDLGRLALLGSALWMAVGILVMKKMINFDF